MTPEKPPEGCRRASGWMVDRAYGELSPSNAIRLEEHLAGCPACGASARETATLAAMRPAVPGAVELLTPRVRRALGDLRVTAAARRVGAFVARLVVAFALAVVSSQVVRARPALAALSGGMSALILLSWTVIYTWLLDQALGEVTPDRPVPLDGRAVAYGVLGAVALSITMLGAFFSDHALASSWCKRSTGALPDVVALLSSGALLMVGLCMGVRLGEKSSPNMLAVLLLYVGIMFPALLRGAPALLRPEDLMFGLGFVALWGLSGAYLGSVLAGSRDVESPRAASL